MPNSAEKKVRRGLEAGFDSYVNEVGPDDSWRIVRRAPRWSVEVDTEASDTNSLESPLEPDAVLDTDEQKQPGSYEQSPREVAALESALRSCGPVRMNVSVLLVNDDSIDVEVPAGDSDKAWSLIDEAAARHGSPVECLVCPPELGAPAEWLCEVLAYRRERTSAALSEYLDAKCARIDPL